MAILTSVCTKYFKTVDRRLHIPRYGRAPWYHHRYLIQISMVSLSSVRAFFLRGIIDLGSSEKSMQSSKLSLTPNLSSKYKTLRFASVLSELSIYQWFLITEA